MLSQDSAEFEDDTLFKKKVDYRKSYKQFDLLRRRRLR
jgi:hypothetical protein